MPTPNTEAIVRAIASIPPGRVASYGMIAARCGLPNAARTVVRVLSSMSGARDLPWHRVVRKDGSIALGRGEGFELQKALLEAEGVEVSASGMIDMLRFAERSP